MTLPPIPFLSREDAIDLGQEACAKLYADAMGPLIDAERKVKHDEERRRRAGKHPCGMCGDKVKKLWGGMCPACYQRERRKRLGRSDGTREKSPYKAMGVPPPTRPAICKKEKPVKVCTVKSRR